MTWILDPLVLASIGGTLRTVIGVVLALAGLGVLLMGVIALADKSVQKGATAAVMGAALIAAGLWLVEAF
ncbi:MAG: hypothetical protein IT460_17510 [Planctomycetes bacterium]|nr:hypothetical protein [Planctomycetota bacterium]